MVFSLKLALASLTGGDRSIGIVRLRNKTTEVFLWCSLLRNIHIEFQVDQNLLTPSTLFII
jgi:hypothetical protein